MFGAALLAILVGAVSAIYPRFWWNILKWQYRHPEAVEPSEAAFTVSRVAGAVSIGLGIWLWSTAASEDRVARLEERKASAPDELVGEFVVEALEAGQGLPSGSDLEEIADRYELSIDVGEEYKLTRQVEVRVGRDDYLTGTPPYCVTFPDGDGDPTIEGGGCPYSQAGLDATRELITKILDTAARRGLSPRDLAVLTEVDPDEGFDEFTPTPNFTADGRVSIRAYNAILYNETRCVTLPADASETYAGGIELGAC